MRAYLLDCKHQAEKSWKWNKALDSQTLCPPTSFRARLHLLNLSTSWCPRTEIWEPMTYIYSNHHTYHSVCCCWCVTECSISENRYSEKQSLQVWISTHPHSTTRAPNTNRVLSTTLVPNNFPLATQHQPCPWPSPFLVLKLTLAKLSAAVSA